MTLSYYNNSKRGPDHPFKSEITEVLQAKTLHRTIVVAGDTHKYACTD
jgi:hypothetical protein